MSIVITEPTFTPVDGTGTPRAGAKRYLYVSGTTTALASYSDAALTTLHAVPQIADANGVFAPAYLPDAVISYRRKLTTAADALISDIDNVPAVSGGFARTAAETTAGVSPTSLEYAPGDVRRYGAAGNGSTADDAAFVAANLQANAGGAPIYVPATASYYKLTVPIALSDGVTLYGDGLKSQIRQTVDAKNGIVAGNDCTVRGVYLRGTDQATIAAGTFDDYNAVYANAKRGVRVEGCYMSHWSVSGVQLEDCQNFHISDNTLWLNRYSAGNSGNSTDILSWSSLDTGARGIITGNFCFSNNSQGIYVASAGRDVDITITNNVCATLNSSWSEVVSGSLERRHGIIVSYDGGGAGRIVVDGNVCRNTRQSGIYRACAADSTVGVVISNNVCSANGVNAVEPTLAAGIYLNNAGPGDLVTGNLIDAFSDYSLFANGAIVSTSTSATNAGRVTISDNTILASAGHGITLVNTAREHVVRGNTILSTIAECIVVSQTGSDATVGGHIIEGNTIFKPATSAGVFISQAAGTKQTYVRGNHIRGSNNSTAASGYNAGVYLSLGTSSTLWVEGNVVETAYYGVYVANNIGSGRQTLPRVQRNHFVSLNTGVLATRTSTNDCLLVPDNTFTSVTNVVGGGAAYRCTLRAGRVILESNSGSAPSDGTWVLGDLVDNTAPVSGGYIGHVCTVAGAPGTWKTYGTIA